jgi:hypothetical protein
MAKGSGQLEALAAELNKATMVLRDGESADVSRVKQLVGAMGQSFTTTVFAFQQASSVKDGIAFVASLAEKFPNEAWLATVAAEQFKRPVNTLRTRYALRDTAQFHEEAGKIAPELSGAEVLRLAREFIVYYGFLLRRIRDQLPFYELGVAFEGHKLVTERVKSSVVGKGVD